MTRKDMSPPALQQGGIYLPSCVTWSWYLWKNAKRQFSLWQNWHNGVTMMR